MVDPNTNGDEPRLVLTGGGSGARVVLAEADAPGSLHYLLEAEGFSIVGCAGDEEELGRVLGQDLRPDVIVLDADIVATSSLVARRLAPDAHVIAVWPEAVQPPPGGERVDPRMVYEELGPAIRRHMDRRAVPVPVIALPAEEPALASVATVAGIGLFGRAASRVSVLSATLITAIVLTMGVSFALGGFSARPPSGPPRPGVQGTSDAGLAGISGDPSTGRVPTGVGSGPSTSHPNKGGSHGPSDHNHASGSLGGVVTTGFGSDSTGGGTTGDPSGGQTDQGGGQGNQGGGSGNQGGGSGNQGGGSGDQGGGSGDQGGGSGGQGNGPGDHGGGQGDGQGGGGQHGGGQGDQGGDGQGDDDQGGSQGDHDGDDQGQSSHAEQNSHSDQGSQGGRHGAHGDGQGA